MLQIKCFHNSQSNLVRTDAHQISLILRKLERFFFVVINCMKLSCCVSKSFQLSQSVGTQINFLVVVRDGLERDLN